MPDVEVGDVHRAALALAVAVAPAEQLGHHAVDVGALGDAVAVAAMVADDAIGDAQVRADADGDRLLADVRVHDAVDPVVEAELERQLLEVTDQHHLAIHLNALAGVERNQLRRLGHIAHLDALSFPGRHSRRTR